MKAPISYRKNIPFFCEKTETDFQKDIYERYEEMVLRQSALQLADELWGNYPMQAVLNFAEEHYPQKEIENILEIGSGVGRWIATVAQKHPLSNCWGIDYSYQMLKRAHEFWVEGREIEIDLSNKGFPQPLQIKGFQIPNLKFGLAKASELPFADQSQDLVLNSFLLDRLDDPAKALKEMFRVLKPNGKLILISPLNFNQAEHWQSFYPPIKIRQLLNSLGFELLAWEENMNIREPLDARNNHIQWNCLAFVAQKKA